MKDKKKIELALAAMITGSLLGGYYQAYAADTAAKAAPADAVDDITMNVEDMFNGDTSALGFKDAGLVPGKSNSKFSTAIGNTGFSNPSIGSDANMSVAIGDMAQVGNKAESSVALGYYSKVAENAKESVSIGQQASVDKEYSVAIGSKADVQTRNAIGIGNNSKIQAGAVNSIAIGGLYRYGDEDSEGGGGNYMVEQDAKDSVVIGAAGLSQSAGATIVGTGARVESDAEHSAAFGENSEVRSQDIEDGDTNGVVSVGNSNPKENDGFTRRLINVSDGIKDTDAATVGQVKKVSDTLKQGGVTAGMVSANDTDNSVAIGTDSTIQGVTDDQKNTLPANGTLVGAQSRIYNNAQNGTAIGENVRISAKNATAVGQGAVVGQAPYAAGSVALGQGSYVGFDGVKTDTNGVVSVGKSGKAGFQRRIINVKDGINDTDAATVGQLNKVGTTVTALNGSAVKFNDNKTEADVQNAALTNVKDVEIAVKGGTRGLVASGITPGTVYGAADGWSEGAAADTASLAIGGGIPDSMTSAASVRGKNSVAIGSGAKVDIQDKTDFENANSVALGVDSNVSGIQSVAVGHGAQATAKQATAVGEQAQANEEGASAFGQSAVAEAANGLALGTSASVGANADNSIAIGTGSTVFSSDLLVSDKNGVVSFGGNSGDRRLIHVADGVKDNDAATVGQIKKITGVSSDKGGAVQYEKDGTLNVNVAAKDSDGKETGDASAITTDGTSIYNRVTKAAGNARAVSGGYATRAITSSGYLDIKDTIVDGDASSWHDQSGYSIEDRVYKDSTNYNAVKTSADGTTFTSGTNDKNTVTTIAGNKVTTGTVNADDVVVGGKSLKDTTQALGDAGIEAGTITQNHEYSTGNMAIGSGSEVAADAEDGYAAHNTAVGNGARAEAGFEYDKDGSFVGRAHNVAGATAFGDSADATGSNSTAIGYGSSTANDNNTAVGANASAGQGAGQYSAAFGSNAQANDDQATALGGNASVSAARGTAIGANANVGYGTDGSVALGAGSVVTKDDLLKDKDGNVTETNGVVSVGDNNYGTNNPKYSFQRRIINVADGVHKYDAVNKGQLDAVQKDVTGLDASAVKFNSDKSEADVQNATLTNVKDVEIAVKGGTRGLVASGVTPGTVYGAADGWSEGAAADTASLAIGGGIPDSMTSAASVRGKNSVALGSGSKVDIEDKTDFENANSVALGVDSNVSGIQSVAVGHGAQATANQATAVGEQSQANGEGSSAFGQNAIVDADNGLALGVGASVGSNANSSIAIGAGSTVFSSDLLTSDKNGVVSFGGSSTDRRLIHVADGVNSNDAATVGQIKKITGVDVSKGDVVQYNQDGSFQAGKNGTGKLNLNKDGSASISSSNGSGFTANADGTNTINGNTDIKGDLSVSGNFTVGGHQIATSEDIKDVSGDIKALGTKVDGVSTTANTNKTNIGDMAKLKEATGKDTLSEAAVANHDAIAKEINDRTASDAALSQGLNVLGGSVHQLGEEVDSVGAISAALAGLHPIDYTGASKLQISTAVGTYDGTQALSLGGFYNVSPDVRLSLGVSTSLNGGDRKTAGNIGATFLVGSGVSRSVVADNSAVDQKVQELTAANEKQQKEIDELKARLDALLKK